LKASINSGHRQLAIPNNLGKINITNALINEALKQRYGKALME
jgi:hypothetical protein